MSWLFNVNVSTCQYLIVELNIEYLKNQGECWVGQLQANRKRYYGIFSNIPSPSFFHISSSVVLSLPIFLPLSITPLFIALVHSFIHSPTPLHPIHSFTHFPPDLVLSLSRSPNTCCRLLSLLPAMTTGLSQGFHFNT